MSWTVVVWPYLYALPSVDVYVTYTDHNQYKFTPCPSMQLHILCALAVSWPLFAALTRLMEIQRQAPTSKLSSRKQQSLWEEQATQVTGISPTPLPRNNLQTDNDNLNNSLEGLTPAEKSVSQSVVDTCTCFFLKEDEKEIAKVLPQLLETSPQPTKSQ